MLPQQPAQKNDRYVVGLGLMIYAEKYSVAHPDIEIQRTYMNILATFARWLVAHENDVRLLMGDLADTGTKEEFKELLRGLLQESEGKHIIDEPVQSVESLLSQIAMSEIVVATRFHNVLLALLCNKPVIAISFHHKCESLMAAMGLSEYCLDINSLEVNVLIEKFCDLKANADNFKLLIKEKVEQFRQELDKQYNAIFKEI
jgi:polysaccharide pyruvyl transferase WcaK-like protein